MQLAGRGSLTPLDRVPVGVLSAASILVLGLLAGGLVVEVIPRLFTIEGSCVSARGWQRSGGDAYFDTVMVVGTLGWLVVAVATIYASITGRRATVLALPIAWFVALVLLALTLATVVGPAACAD
jgi:hypothetical protein